MNDHLYVATARKLIRYAGVLQALKGEKTTIQRSVVNPTAFPYLKELQWHYLRSYKGELYAANSAGCDHCLPDTDQAAAIVKFDEAKCFLPEVYVSGMRFSVGFTFHEPSDRIIFTNNA